MRGNFAVLGFSLMWLVYLSPEAKAQHATSFEQLQSLVRPGDTIEVTGADGKSTNGKIESLSATALRLASNGGVRDFSQRDAVEIKQRRSDSLANGALIGAAVGGASGGALVLAYSADYGGHGGGAQAAAEIGLATGIGALIGVVVDAMITHHQTIYRTPGTAGFDRVRVSPLVAGDRKGVALSVSF